MESWALTAAVVLALALATKGERVDKEAIREMIRQIARAQGVPVPVALAFAELESSFSPRRSGDHFWAHNHPDRYAKHVLNNPRFARNPARSTPSAWGSYGLYGLLAWCHTRPDEHPRVLFDPQINAQRGIAAIRRLLLRFDGDVTAARLAYVGCGPDGDRCNLENVDQVREKLWEALSRWQAVERERNGGTS